MPTVFQSDRPKVGTRYAIFWRVTLHFLANVVDRLVQIGIRIGQRKLLFKKKLRTRAISLSSLNETSQETSVCKPISQ